MKWIKAFIDFLLYGNLWIAACAAALLLPLQLILLGEFRFDPLFFFLFSATLFLYAVHRIVGIAKLQAHFKDDRYQVISRFRHHIQIYAAIGLIGSIYTFFQLQFATQLAVVIPAFLSIGYVLPFLRPNKAKGDMRRLRDIHFVKIFLVALVWAATTVLMPAIEYGWDNPWQISLLFLERSAFIFAITLPFDLRDLQVDQFIEVKTIPAIIGLKATKRLAYACLGLMLLASVLLWGLGFYHWGQLLAIVLSAASTLWLVWWVQPQSHDYWFSGLMDGTMLLQALLVVLGSGV